MLLVLFQEIGAPKINLFRCFLLSRLGLRGLLVGIGCFGRIAEANVPRYAFFGFKLGFWFAQQGAIYAFVALIFIYSWRMKTLERKFGVDDDEENS